MDRRVFFEGVKKHFNYLMDDYQFSVLDEITFNSFDNAAVILWSKKCKIRIFLDRSSVTVDFGPMRAPLLGSTRAQRDLWYDLVDIVAVIENWGVDVHRGKRFYAPVDESLPYNEQIDSQIADIANKLKPYCPQIIEMFKKGNFRKTQKELNAFRQKSWDAFGTRLEKWKKTGKGDPFLLKS